MNYEEERKRIARWIKIFEEREELFYKCGQPDEARDYRKLRNKWLEDYIELGRKQLEERYL